MCVYGADGLGQWEAAYMAYMVRSVQSDTLLQLTSHLVFVGPLCSYAGVILDDCNFHECVNLDDFDSTKTLALVPPEGEFVVMNYRVTSEFRTPFRIFPTLEETSPYKVELVLRVRATHSPRAPVAIPASAARLPHAVLVSLAWIIGCLQVRADIPDKYHGSNVVVTFPVPRTAATVTPELGSGAAPAPAARGVAAAIAASAAAAGAAGAGPGQVAEYNAKDRVVAWTIKKFQGGQEHCLRTKITLSSPSTSTIRKELGPISMSFEIPMYNVSNLQVRYLRIAETHKSYKPHRWVRYVATSNSYVCRL
ncbi:hypothetical protein EON66_08110 [archaeon]|nr:MAG: hypothetical protein EON66_08110 [archaeon]